jgi:hypothetical protein
MFFEDIRSERQLMKVAADRLSVRWFLGYDLNEALPDHSSLTKIRERYGLETFRRFFEEIVELCVEAGLVWGEELYFDSTKVEANAALDSLAPRWAVEAHLGELFDEEEEEPTTAETIPAVASGKERCKVRLDIAQRSPRALLQERLPAAYLRLVGLKDRPRGKPYDLDQSGQ